MSMDDDADIVVQRRFLMVGTWNNMGYDSVLTTNKSVTVATVTAYLVKTSGPRLQNDYMAVYELSPGSYTMDGRKRVTTRSDAVCILRLG
jgi:hypothetical protein